MNSAYKSYTYALLHFHTKGKGVHNILSTGGNIRRLRRILQSRKHMSHMKGS